MADLQINLIPAVPGIKQARTPLALRARILSFPHIPTSCYIWALVNRQWFLTSNTTYVDLLSDLKVALIGETIRIHGWLFGEDAGIQLLAKLKAKSVIKYIYILYVN